MALERYQSTQTGHLNFQVKHEIGGKNQEKIRTCILLYFNRWFNFISFLSHIQLLFDNKTRI